MTVHGDSKWKKTKVMQVYAWQHVDEWGNDCTRYLLIQYWVTRGIFSWGQLTNNKHHILQQTRVLTNAVYPDLSFAFTSSPFRSRVSISSTCPESAADHNPRSNSISSSVWRTDGDATWQPQSWSQWGTAMKPAVPDRWTPLVIKTQNKNKKTQFKLILIKNSKRPTTSKCAPK